MRAKCAQNAHKMRSKCMHFSILKHIAPHTYLRGGLHSRKFYPAQLFWLDDCGVDQAYYQAQFYITNDFFLLQPNLDVHSM